MAKKVFYGKSSWNEAVLVTMDEFEAFVEMLEPSTGNNAHVYKREGSTGWIRNFVLDVPGVGKVRAEADLSFQVMTNAGMFYAHKFDRVDPTHVRINTDLHYFGKGARDSRTWKIGRTFIADMLLDADEAGKDFPEDNITLAPMSV